MVKKVLVTGGCGFIGANLIPRLADLGCRVRVVDNLSRGYLAFIEGVDVEFVKGDICDTNAMDDVMKGVDAVIHLAAYGSVVESVDDPILNFDINARGTLNVLDAARKGGVKKLIFASTGGALIGDAEPPVSEESAPRPKSPYGASKLVGEGYCSAFAGSYDCSTVILRFGNIYGPVSAHKKGAVTAFCKSLLNEEPFVIYGDGSASRDFLYVDDLCDGILRALDHDLDPGTLLHLATGRETTISELADVLRAVAGKPDHDMIYKGARAGEVHRNFAGYGRAKAMLGYEPRVSLEDGLRRTWEWFRSQGDMALGMTMTDA